MFSVAYGIPVTAAEIIDPARALQANGYFGPAVYARGVATSSVGLTIRRLDVLPKEAM